MGVRIIEAEEMFGFKIINIFPETCTDDDWIDFAEAMSKILDEDGEQNQAFA